MSRPLSVAFLWHHHQPYYKDLSSGKYVLPWVRLHCTKDYYDMVAILDEFPDIHQTFNLVPSLIEQINDYVFNNATDKFLDLTLKPAQKLTPKDRIFILHNFFMANWNTMVEPYPRYAELFHKRGEFATLDTLKNIHLRFNSRDFLDLQVWFNLTWMDPYFQKNDILIRDLINKGKDFSEKDKINLISKQREIMAKIIPKYKELQDRGQIEITTTPFYHPILPLICDTDIAKESISKLILPKERFFYPEDAQWHIQKAIQLHQECFGKKPKGMWPAEGSVSEEIIPLIAKAGIQWIASDEDVLLNSFSSKEKRYHKERLLYKPYKVKKDEHSLSIVFRDKKISNLIGFTCSNLETDAAVDLFMKNLYNIWETVSLSGEDHLLSIILDGENCWEYYKNDGRDFLTKIYKILSADHNFQTVTVSEYLEQFPFKTTLPKLWPGSWINHDFGVWIGHPEDNLAWDSLSCARKDLKKFEKTHPQDEYKEIIEKAWKEIYIAEGSDWNWWYGDDHCSGNDDAFDNLFRKHLISVYELIGEKVPNRLYVAIKGQFKTTKTAFGPIGFLSPKIDGKVNNYFEWYNAGFYDVGKLGGTMHQTKSIIKSFHYGFDLNNLYLRIDTTVPLLSGKIGQVTFKLVFLNTKKEIILNLFQEKDTPGKAGLWALDESSGNKFFVEIKPIQSVAVDKIIEAAVSFTDIGVKDDEEVAFVIVVEKESLEIERWPNRNLVHFIKPKEDYFIANWSA